MYIYVSLKPLALPVIFHLIFMLTTNAITQKALNCSDMMFGTGTLFRNCSGYLFITIIKNYNVQVYFLGLFNIIIIIGT